MAFLENDDLLIRYDKKLFHFEAECSWKFSDLFMIHCKGGIKVISGCH